MAKKLTPISAFLKIKSLIDVVDIGANPIDEEALYKSLLIAGLARVIGFDQNLDAWV